MDKSNGLTLDKDVVSDNNTDVFVDVGNDSDNSGEVFSLDCILKSRELTKEIAGIVDKGSVVINNNGGVCFFNESLNTNNNSENINSDSRAATEHGNELVELSEVSVWDFKTIENEELEDFSEVLTSGKEVSTLEAELESVELHGEGHEVGEETGAKAILRDILNFVSDGIKEGSDKSDGLAA